jgi:hypothetical protein
MVRRIHIDDTGITRFDRQTFIHEVFDYSDGDHCTFLCPFGGGKTQLALDLIAVCATPDRQATVFVMKPKDRTITKYTPILGFETIRDWPPSQVKLFKRIFGKRPPGYVLWPRDTGNIDYDEWNQRNVFTRALSMMYSAAKKKPNIMFCDETYSLEKELKPDPVPPPFLVERPLPSETGCGRVPSGQPTSINSPIRLNTCSSDTTPTFEPRNVTRRSAAESIPTS